MRAIHRAIGAVSLTLAVGCAPAERSTDPGNSETAFAAGSMAGAVSGPIGPAQTTNSAQVTLTGVVADFTRLGIVGSGDSPGFQAVYFATRGDSGAPHLWRINVDGSGLSQLTTDSSGQVFPAISRAGDRVAFRDLKLSGGQPTATDLWQWTPRGGSQFLAAETGVVDIAGWVPGDTAIVYPVAAGSDVGLRQRGIPTGPVVHLTDVPDDRTTTGLVNGVPTTFFTRNSNIYQISLTTHDTSVFLQHDDFSNLFGPDLSPDGTKLLYWGEDIRFFTLLVTSIDHSDTLQLFGFPSRGQPWHPEARWVGDSAVVATDEQDRGNFRIVPQLGFFTLASAPSHRLTDFDSGVENGFSVGPFLRTPPRGVIGEDGELGSRASGIIYGLGRQGELTAVLSFNANRQRSVTLKAETGLNAEAPVLTYTITADRLLSLGYLSNPADGPAVSVIDSSSAVASGAIVSFDGVTGAVSLVIPFATNVVGAEPVTVKDEGGVRMFRGGFTGVWRGGRNVARNGASEVRLQLRGGRVEVR